MRNRLIAFGCSNAFGHGLEDCHVPPFGPGWKPSQYAWPQLLADKLDVQCVNNSVPGASNKMIWNIAMHETYRFTDTVMILWTHPERTCVLYSDTDPKNMNDISVHHDNKASKVFYKYLYNKVDMNIDLNLRMQHVHLYLNSLGVRNYHAMYNHKEHTLLQWNTTPVLATDFDLIQQNYPKALDEAHPGHEAHQEYANQLYKEITEKK